MARLVARKRVAVVVDFMVVDRLKVVRDQLVLAVVESIAGSDELANE